MGGHDERLEELARVISCWHLLGPFTASSFAIWTWRLATQRTLVRWGELGPCHCLVKPALCDRLGRLWRPAWHQDRASKSRNCQEGRRNCQEGKRDRETNNREPIPSRREPAGLKEPNGL